MDRNERIAERPAFEAGWPVTFPVKKKITVCEPDEDAGGVIIEPCTARSAM